MDNHGLDTMPRAPHLRSWEEENPPEYGNDSMFTVVIEHNGRFCGLGADLDYIQGTPAFVDYCNTETWSILWIDEMLKQLGYERDDLMHLYWLKPGKVAIDGLLGIQSDADIAEMLKAVSAGHKTLCLIVDHTNFMKRLRGDVCTVINPSNPPDVVPDREHVQVDMTVSFHAMGCFRRDGNSVDYVGEEVVHEVRINRGDLCFNELMNYAEDVYHIELGRMDIKVALKLHWLAPGKTLSDGLMFVGDNDDIKMIDLAIGYDEKAEIYIEEVLRDEAKEVHMEEVVQIPVTETYSSHNWNSKDLVIPVQEAKQEQAKLVEAKLAEAMEQHVVDAGVTEDAPPVQESDDDTEYEPIPDDSSGEDSEAEQMRKLSREIRLNERNRKLGRGTHHIIKDNAVVTHGSGDEGGPYSESESEYFDSDDQYSDTEQSDGEGGKTTVRKKSTWPRYNSKEEGQKFQLGMVFRSKEQMKKALIKYGIKEKHHLAFTKDEHGKVRAHCTWESCPWTIYASRTSKNKWLQVSTLVDEHHCVPRRDNKLVNSTYLAKRFGSLIKANPTWQIKHFQQTVLQEVGVDVSEAQCKRAKQLVFRKLMDSTKGEYSKVFDYQLALLNSNPGSTVAVKMDPDQPDDTHVFQRFYMCFSALKKGFLAGCRKVIGLDGCFFKGACFGQMLCALGRDANNQMYPIAWAVVEKENYDSWFWFLALLNKDLRIANQAAGWVFISDQQKGLLAAIEDIMPRAEHRMCARHIYSNWKKKHPNHDLQKLFWRCAKSPNRVLFNYNRAKLAQFTVDGAKDMMNTDPQHWSRAFMEIGSNCDSVDNNMCECFNNYIIESRYLPVVSMLEWIRRKMTVRVQQNMAKSAKWKGTICPNIFKKLKMNIARSTNVEVLWNGKEGFEVQEHQKYRFTVNLERRTCTCRYFQLSGLPCCHAISAIYASSRQIDDYIADCYSIRVYNKIYDHCLEPMEGEESWPTADQPRPNPPGFIKLPGRPKTERRRAPDEGPKGSKLSRVGQKITCSNCKRKGHNMSSCTNNPVAKHHGNAHIVRDRTKKRKQQQNDFEMETSKRAKENDDAARERKGKNVLVPEDAVAKALRTRPTGLKIPGTDSQQTVKPTAKASTEQGTNTTSKPNSQPTNKPSSKPIRKTSSQSSSQPLSQPSSQPNQLENRKIVNLCQPFVTPRPTDTSHQKSFNKYKPEAPPKHTSFNLAAFRAAKDLQRK